MAVIFKVTDAEFTNYVRVIEPPKNGLKAWWDFGVDFTSSTTDKSGKGNNLVSLGTATGLTYTQDTVVFPQTSSSQNVLVAKNLALASHTIATKILAGQHERIASFPVSSSIGLLVNSSGHISYVVYTSASTPVSVSSSKTINRPIAAVASVDVSIPNTLTLKLHIKDDFGVTETISQTFSGTIGGSYATQDMRIGNNAVGSMELTEIIIYDRAVSDLEAQALLLFLN